MNKKGFTLVELLAVIIILGLLIAIAVPSYIGVSKRIKEKMWDNKLKMIETAVEMYVQDNKNYFCIYDSSSNKWIATDELIEGPIRSSSYTIKRLIQDGYLTADDDEKFINPIDNQNYFRDELCDTDFSSDGINSFFYYCNGNDTANRGADKLCQQI